MKDYLLIIRTEGSVWNDLTSGQLKKHLEHGGAYIADLMKKGVLKGANPIEVGGSRLVSEQNGILKDSMLSDGKDILAGFFHISVKDIDEAIEIAKHNPIFEDISTKIEVHPMMPIGGN